MALAKILGTPGGAPSLVPRPPPRFYLAESGRRLGMRQVHQQHNKNTAELTIRGSGLSYEILGTSGGAPTAQHEHCNETNYWSVPSATCVAHSTRQHVLFQCGSLVLPMKIVTITRWNHSPQTLKKTED